MGRIAVFVVYIEIAIVPTLDAANLTGESVSTDDSLTSIVFVIADTLLLASVTQDIFLASV